MSRIVQQWEQGDPLVSRLRDVDEPNALLVRRQAAERLVLYEATIADLTEQRDMLSHRADWIQRWA